MSVLMCSGQGAQKPGMGSDVLHVPEVAHAFAVASEVLGFDLASLATRGSEDEINDTYHAQGLMMALSVGLGSALISRGEHVEAVLGFSLGEISALALAQVLSVEDAFALLNVRARAMDAACRETSGAMLALLAASEEDALEVCERCAEDDVLVIANYNCPGQIVLSGSVAAIDRAQTWWCGNTAKRARASRLKTAGAFHSPLMRSAADEVRTFCAGLEFAEPARELICNTDARPFVASEAADRLARQIVSPVRFEQSVRFLLDQGSNRFVEVGFGGVLFTMMKRIDKEAERYRIGSDGELTSFLTNDLRTER